MLGENFQHIKKWTWNSRGVIPLDIVPLSRKDNFLELFSDCPPPHSEVVYKEAEFNPAQTNMTGMHVFVAVLVTSWGLCEKRKSWCTNVCAAEVVVSVIYSHAPHRHFGYMVP